MKRFDHNGQNHGIRGIHGKRKNYSRLLSFSVYSAYSVVLPCNMQNNLIGCPLCREANQAGAR